MRQVIDDFGAAHESFAIRNRRQVAADHFKAPVFGIAHRVLAAQHPDSIAVARHQVMHQMRTNETRGACHSNHHKPLLGGDIPVTNPRAWRDRRLTSGA